MSLGDDPCDIHKQQSKYDCLKVTGSKRLRTLEKENAKLMMLAAEAMLEIAVVKNTSAAKW